MFSIKETTIGDAWLNAVFLVLQEGRRSIPDDKGMIQEVLSLVIQITAPSEEDMIVQEYGSQEVLSFMRKNFQEQQSIANWKYSYADRLYNYNGANQIQHVIKVLRSNAFSKSATISLLNTAADDLHTPCLVALDFKLRDNTLFITGFFRSQDIGKKMYADAIQLLHLGKLISASLNVEAIEITHFINSAHIYESDRPILLLMLEQIKRIK